MRKFLKIFLRSLGTYLGQQGGLSQALVIVGFNRLVIFITYGMRSFAMEAVSLVCILAKKLTSVPMCSLIFCCLQMTHLSVHANRHLRTTL